MKRFPGNSELIDEYNELCAKGHAVKRFDGLTFHHILPRCMWPEEKDNPENWSWLSFEDHWLAHYLLWKATGELVYASAFWFICVYGLKNRGMKISDEDYAQLKKDVAAYRLMKKKERMRERYARFKSRNID